MEQKDHSKCGFGMCGEGCGHKWCRVVKWLVWFAVFTAVFALGMLSGAVKTVRYYNRSVVPGGMMSGYGIGTQTFGRSWMMGNYGIDTKNLQKVFGSITSIEGSKIAIMDNGEKATEVFSTSNTIILAGQEEISISALSVGQDITVLGTLNAGNQLEAKYIYTKGF